MAVKEVKERERAWVPAVADGDGPAVHESEVYVADATGVHMGDEGEATSRPAPDMVRGVEREEMVVEVGARAVMCGATVSAQAAPTQRAGAWGAERLRASATRAGAWGGVVQTSDVSETEVGTTVQGRPDGRSARVSDDASVPKPTPVTVIDE